MNRENRIGPDWATSSRRISPTGVTLKSMLRRTFLGAMAGVAAARPQAPAPTGIRLGYDSYSLRAWRWNALQHIEYAAGLKLDSIQISSLTEFENLEPAYLQK